MDGHAAELVMDGGLGAVVTAISLCHGHRAAEGLAPLRGSIAVAELLSRQRRRPPPRTPTNAASATRPAARKAPAKNASAAKEPAEMTPAQRSGGSDRPRKTRASAPRAESKRRRSAADVADRAVQQLTRLTGRRTEGVTGVERN